MGSTSEALTKEIDPKKVETKSGSSLLEQVDEPYGGSPGRFLAGRPGQPLAQDAVHFLRNPRLNLSRNAGVRNIAIQRAQQTYGNRFVQRALAGQLGSTPGKLVQRKCKCGGTCAECSEQTGLSIEEIEKRPQRKGEGDLSSLPESFTPAIQRSGGGSLLPSGSRSFMESRFGQDFTDVRVHNDSAAGEAAQDLNAQAFTTGRDIYFAPGRFQPQTPEGQKLLAHELTHVVQQRDGRAASTSAKPLLGAPGDAFEQEADRAAEMVAGPGRVSLSGASVPHRLQRAAAASPAVKKAPKPFMIPGEKLAGPADRNKVLGIYKSLAKAGQLRDVHTGRVESTAWPHWNRGRSKEVQDQLGSLRQDCSPDHVVELQVGGPDDPWNLRLLGRDRNTRAGTRIWNEQVRPLKEPGTIIEFTDAEAETPEGTDACLKFDLPNWSGELKGDATRRRGKEFVDLTVGASTVHIAVDDSGNVVRGSRGAISGFEIYTVIFDDKDEPARIEGVISTGIKEFLKTRTQQKVVLLVQKGTVKLDPSSKTLKLAFRYLSEADLNLSLGDADFGGEGKFHPSLPLLGKAEVHIKAAQGKFGAGVKVGGGDLTLPIPGVNVTECSLEAGFAETKFYAAGNLSFKVSTFVEAKLKADADADGFKAVGTVDFFIPGLDKAQGTITYAGGKLAGQIKIGKDKFKLPGVKSASLLVSVTDSAVTGTGEVLLDVPGIKQGTLGFSVDKKGNYSITGVATLSIPGLKTAEVGLTYAAGDLEGTAKVGLDIPGLEGAGAEFNVNYAKGALTGSGQFSYKKGKLSGQVHAALSEKHKLSGGGELAYEIIPGLVAAVGMEIREDGKAKISGELRIPDKIDLFPEKKIEKTIFSVGTQIPIFAIPLGTRSVGLVAEIGADLKARAGFGPGQIRQLKVKAAFDPSKEESQFEFSGGGELFVPAFAELALGVHGGIGLSLAIASATGGIELVGALGLQGALSAMVQITYQNKQFAVDAVAELSAQPVIKFSINAYVKVEVFLIGEVYRKDWKLASKEWGSGLKIGLRFPVHYEFGKPFELSLKQVEFIVPDIDYKKAVTDLLPM